MNNFTFDLLVFVGSLLAGFLGAMTGLGGGVVLVPLLVLVFGVDMSYAIGASLIAVIATSSGAAAAYVKEGYSNIRIGMFLEVATTSGALIGAALAVHMGTSFLAVIFGVVLLASAFLSARGQNEPATDGAPDRISAWLRLDSSYPTAAGPAHYHVRRIPLGFALMGAAGILSGLFGIGSGAFKVLAMDQAMRIPFKVSTTTSNFMIGVTAAASAGIYLARGYIDPGLTFPVVLGVLAGAYLGARTLPRTRTHALRIIFALVICAVGVQMIYKGLVEGL